MNRGIENRDTIFTSATFDCSYEFRVRSSQANRQKFCCFRLSRFDDSGGENGRFIRKRRTEGESRKTEGIRWKHLFVVDQWVFFLSITFHFPVKHTPSKLDVDWRSVDLTVREEYNILGFHPTDRRLRLSCYEVIHLTRESVVTVFYKVGDMF